MSKTAMSGCRWVISPAGSQRPARYCGQPVAYRVVEDDDQNRKRKYDPFCPRHTKEAEEQEEAEQDQAMELLDQYGHHPSSL